MNCNEVRQHWELYYDSEGDSELYLRINEHLAACQGCAKWFFQQAEFEDALTARLAAANPTAEVWQRVLCKTGVARPAVARTWSFFGSLLALAAAILLIVGVWQFAPLQRTPEALSRLTAVVHRQLTEESKRIEFTSLSDIEVETYLKQRVSFPVRCPPRKDAGFAVRGGGVCTIAGQTAAYVVGQVDRRDVSLFILPAERLDEFAREGDALRRVAIHHCREGEYEMVLARIDRNVVVVIGRSSPERLERIIRAYGTYPHDPA